MGINIYRHELVHEMKMTIEFNPSMSSHTFVSYIISFHEYDGLAITIEMTYPV